MEENKNIQEENKIENNNQVNSPNEVKNNVQSNPPTKSNNGLIGILIAIIILLTAVVIYMLFFNKPKEELKENNEQTQSGETNINNQNEVKENNEDKKYELTVYKHKENEYLDESNEVKDYLEEAFTIKVKSKSAKVLAVNNNGNKYLLYEDDGLYLYDVKNQTSRKLNIESNYPEYEMYLSEDESKVIGIGYKIKDVGEKGWTIGYYNVELGKKLYDGKYTIGYLPMDLQVTDDAISLHFGNEAYLLSSKEEKIELSEKMDGYAEFDVFGKKGSYIYALSDSVEEPVIKKLYSNSKKLFYTNEGEHRFSYYNDYMYIADGNIIKKFNSNGETLSTSSQYDNLEYITNDYAIYIKNSEVYLENIDNPRENKKIAKMQKDYYIWSYYYTRKELDAMKETNKKEGLYIGVEYSKKDANGNYGMEYCYTPDKKIIEYPIKQEIGGRAKPVLYLYPETETNVTVKFSHPEYLTTTYPKYNNEWEVIVKPNGDMKGKDGKYYYALYWDEKRYNEVDFKEGFYVESKDAIKFLEEKLAMIGLNDKERNEFIMYWLPIMESNKKNLVYFELTEERELGNKLIIEPKPDSLLRVSIHIKKVNEKVSIKEQKLSSFNRQGFTAVEWGGMTY